MTRLAKPVMHSPAMTHDPALYDELLAYASTDLLCYRAEAPAALAERQNALWNPLLLWARERYGWEFLVTTGIMPIQQPPATMAGVGALLSSMDEPRREALYMAVRACGSLVLGLALMEKRITAEEAFTLSQADESWQVENNGDLEVLRKRRDEILNKIQKAAAGLAALT